MDEETEIIILKNSLKYLHNFFVWPDNEAIFNTERCFFIQQILMTASSLSLLMGSIWHIIFVTGGGDGEIDYDIAVVISMVGTYYFNFSFVAQVNNLSRLYSELSKFTQFGKPENFDEENAKLSKYSKWHFIYITLTIWNFSLSPRHRDNSIDLFYKILQVLTGSENPFEKQNMFIMFLSYCLTFYCGMFSYATSSIISFTIMESVEHIVIRLKHVQFMFACALDHHDKISAKKGVGECITYHSASIRLAGKLNDSFYSCMFLHVLLTGAILGCVSYTLLKGSDVLNSALLFIGWFCSLVMVSSAGERLITESVAVGMVVSQSNWYDLHVNLQQNLVTVLLRCQKPMHLDAGPFGHMSFEMVLKILKTAYSCLTVMATYQS